MLMILVIILVVLLLAGYPGWGYHSLGWAPSSVVGIILVIVVVLLLLGRL
jgi:hypothetical protein